MKQLPITTYGMDVLRKKTVPVKDIDNSIISLVRNMFYTMDKASGIGLAAPQVNLSLSVAVIDISGIDEYKNQKPLVLINPTVIETHGKVTMEEGCLSIPDIRADVERPDEVHIRYHDFDMNEVDIELSGFIARVAQHEIDHLNGRLFVDLISDESKKELKKELLLIKKGIVEADYPLLINTEKV
ncbi:MAG: peptide deformylase [Ignavibacteria bacterium]|nr:peptide deformylase [Ignavibacteria bacterium]